MSIVSFCKDQSFITAYSMGTTSPVAIEVPAVQHARKKYETKTTHSEG